MELEEQRQALAACEDTSLVSVVTAQKKLLDLTEKVSRELEKEATHDIVVGPTRQPVGQIKLKKLFTGIQVTVTFHGCEGHLCFPVSRQGSKVTEVKDFRGYKSLKSQLVKPTLQPGIKRWLMIEQSVSEGLS